MKRLGIFVVAITTGVFGAISGAEAQLPFQNISQAPTVSPYLNLITRQQTGLPTYQTLVQPLLQQQQDYNHQQNQIQNLAQQQKELTTGGLTQPTRGISTAIRPSGHPTLFMLHGNYYPRTPLQTNDPITRRLVTGDYTQ